MKTLKTCVEAIPSPDELGKKFSSEILVTIAA